MQKFCDLPYERPDVEGVGRQLETLVEKLKNAGSYAEARALLMEKETM